MSRSAEDCVILVEDFLSNLFACLGIHIAVNMKDGSCIPNLFFNEVVKIETLLLSIEENHGHTLTSTGKVSNELLPSRVITKIIYLIGLGRFLIRLIIDLIIERFNGVLIVLKGNHEDAHLRKRSFILQVFGRCYLIDFAKQTCEDEFMHILA